MRAFVAVLLTRGARTFVTKQMERVQREQMAGTRWIRPEGVHLTLKFLGDVSPDRVSAIVQTIDMVARATALITIQLGNIGVFLSLKAPRVIWIEAVRAKDALLDLRRVWTTRWKN